MNSATRILSRCTRCVRQRAKISLNLGIKTVHVCSACFMNGKYVYVEKNLVWVLLSPQPTQCNQLLSWAVLVEEIYQCNPQLPLTMVCYRYPTHTHTHTHTPQITISSQIGWSQFPSGRFICLFFKVLAIFPHHSRQGVIQGGSIQQSSRKNRIT